MLQFVKIGSACLFDEHNNLNRNILRARGQDILRMWGEYPTVLVVSGAIELGRRVAGESRPKSELSEQDLQTLASVGQLELMRFYQEVMPMQVSQILLTQHDLNGDYDVHIRDNIENTVQKGWLPCVNNNDGTDWSQLRRDNEPILAQLMRYCAQGRLCNGGLRGFILGADYSGFLVDGRVRPVIAEVTPDLYDHCGEPSEIGNGGPRSKLDAAKVIQEAGGSLYISNIKYRLQDIVEDRVERTYFPRR